MGRVVARSTCVRGSVRSWLLLGLVVSACSGAASSRTTETAARAPAAARHEAGDLMAEADLERLAALSQARSGASADASYRIGPDDLLEIAIPDLLDAQPYPQGASSGAGGSPGPQAVAASPSFQRGERVDDRGEITLPWVGSVRVAGSTPPELEAEIGRRLIAKGILRRPQVSVQIAEYRSRVVAVVGNVERPGTYPLTRPGATVADMVWAAGGPGKDAGRIVLFSPGRAEPERLAAHATPRSDADPLVAEPGAKPIRIDLQALLNAAETGWSRLNPEVRPGDVISVSGAGSVLVEGWVDKPGSYPVTAGLTLSGALVAAGGSVYAADLAQVSVRRTLAPGEQRTFLVDVEAVAEGRQADLAILDGDVVTVPVHSARAVPYGLWKLGREVIHVGASVPIF